MDWQRWESPAYWSVFVVLFLGIGVWEGRAAWRPLTVAAEQRWLGHGALVVVAIVVQSLLVRMSPLVLAAEMDGHGLFGRFAVPWWGRFFVGLLAFDFANYWSHRVFHAVPWLWRIHAVHHSDPDYDVSTALRFHPIEVIGGTLLRLGVIALLGPPVACVVVSELHTVAVNLLAHANARLSGTVEGWLRFFVITPDLHRIHHSRDEADFQRNFGQTLVVWDRLFGTYKHEPIRGADGLATGMVGRGAVSVWALLAEPFRRG